MKDGSHQQRRVIFAIPSYDCSIHLEAAGAMIVAGRELQKAGIEWGFIYQGGSSIISRARNALVHKFLQIKQATDLVFLDSDVVFTPADVLRLIAWGEMKDIVCGAYRVKKEDMQFSVQMDTVSGENGEVLQFDETGRLVKIKGIGAGFMLIRRNVFETMKEKLDIPACPDPSLGEDTTTFFHFDISDDNIYIGEDIYFCKKAQEAGFDIWVDPSLNLTHVGLKEYTGRLQDFFAYKTKPEENIGGKVIKEIA